MKSFQAVIISAILAAATAANEPVASPTFFKQELAEYEHQLRNLQGSMSVPTKPPTPLRPVVPQSGSLGETQTSPPVPSGVSSLLLYLIFVTSAAAAAASHHSPTVSRCLCTNSLSWPSRRFVWSLHSFSFYIPPPPLSLFLFTHSL